MQGLKDILTEERSICRAPGVSKKRVFETIANIICENQSNLSYSSVLGKLIAPGRAWKHGAGQWHRNTTLPRQQLRGSPGNHSNPGAEYRV